MQSSNIELLFLVLLQLLVIVMTHVPESICKLLYQMVLI